MSDQAAEPGGAAGRKILIVDDEPDVVTYLTTLFEDNGYAVVTAADGKVGMEQARKEKPDVITLDISMPEESGVKMFRQLQADPATENIPVIIVTGISSDFERFIRSRRQLKEPAGYFEKPIDRQELLDTVRKILSD